MAHWLLRGAGNLLNQLFPPACPLCSRTFPCSWSEPFCSGCLQGFLPLPDAHCPRCALPFSAAAGSVHLCGHCSRKPPPYTKVYSAGLYQQELRRAIHQFKFNNAVGLDRPLGVLLERALAKPLAIDLILPVPMHRRRLRQRSYNQALLLARELGRLRGLPVASRLLLRVKQSAPQQGLTARERESNLRGAFEVVKKLGGARVLLVDDVMTTGATARECAEVLLDAGATAVEVAVVGRAPAEVLSGG